MKQALIAIAFLFGCSDSPTPAPDAGPPAAVVQACNDYCQCFAAPSPIPCREGCYADPDGTLDAGPCPIAPDAGS